MLVLEACGSLVLYTGISRVRTSHYSLHIVENTIPSPQLYLEKLHRRNRFYSCSCFEFPMIFIGVNSCLMDVWSMSLFLQVSKVFVPGFLSPTFSLANHTPHLSTPMENVSTPTNAGSRHFQRLDEVPPCVINMQWCFLLWHSSSVFTQSIFHCCGDWLNN